MHGTAILYNPWGHAIARYHCCAMHWLISGTCKVVSIALLTTLGNSQAAFVLAGLYQVVQ